MWTTPTLFGFNREILEAKMSNEAILKSAKTLADNAKNEKTKEFANGLISYYKENGSFTPAQVSGLQNIMKNASFQFAEETEINEVSKKTLGSYVKNSTQDLIDIQRDITSNGIKHPDYKFLSKKRKNRKTGISNAINRLTKEDVNSNNSVHTIMEEFKLKG